MPSSSRWCPTPEQVMILEEMYRGGTRTPNASKIQQITSHLSLFGKIEGKNVFYWFQNHKAREREKHRMKLISHKLLRHQQQQNHHHHLLHYLESHLPPHTPPPPELPHYNSGGVDTWKLDDHLPDQRCEMDKSMVMGTYGSDWMMMMNVGPAHHSSFPSPPPPCRNNKPLKTLDLFPITSTPLNVCVQGGLSLIRSEKDLNCLKPSI